MPNNINVIIAGAGPAGLANGLAALQEEGCTVTLLETRSKDAHLREQIVKLNKESVEFLKVHSVYNRLKGKIYEGSTIDVTLGDLERAMREAFEKKGGKILYNTTITKVEPELTIPTQEGVITTPDLVVIAEGAGDKSRTNTLLGIGRRPLFENAPHPVFETTTRKQTPTKGFFSTCLQKVASTCCKIWNGLAEIEVSSSGITKTTSRLKTPQATYQMTYKYNTPSFQPVASNRFVAKLDRAERASEKQGNLPYLLSGDALMRVDPRTNFGLNHAIQATHSFIDVLKGMKEKKDIDELLSTYNDEAEKSIEQGKQKSQRVYAKADISSQPSDPDRRFFPILSY
jgi:hypothetical protein